MGESSYLKEQTKIVHFFFLLSDNFFKLRLQLLQVTGTCSSFILQSKEMQTDKQWV